MILTRHWLLQNNRHMTRCRFYCSLAWYCQSKHIAFIFDTLLIRWNFVDMRKIWRKGRNKFDDVTGQKIQKRANSRRWCGIRWSDFHFFAIIENGHIAIDWQYLYKFNSKKSANFGKVLIFKKSLGPWKSIFFCRNFPFTSKNNCQKLNYKIEFV